MNYHKIVKAHIYTLSCPKTKQVFYVGLTIEGLNKRLEGHIYSMKHNNTPVARYLSFNNINPIIEELEFYPKISIRNARKKEAYWIDQFRQWGFNLLNRTSNLNRPVINNLIDEFFK